MQLLLSIDPAQTYSQYSIWDEYTCIEVILSGTQTYKQHLFDLENDATLYVFSRPRIDEAYLLQNVAVI